MLKWIKENKSIYTESLKMIKQTLKDDSDLQDKKFCKKESTSNPFYHS